MSTHSALVLVELFVSEVRHGLVRVDSNEHRANIRVDVVVHETLPKIFRNGILGYLRDQHHVLHSAHILLRVALPMRWLQMRGVMLEEDVRYELCKWEKERRCD